MRSLGGSKSEFKANAKGVQIYRKFCGPRPQAGWVQGVVHQQASPSEQRQGYNCTVKYLKEDDTHFDFPRLQGLSSLENVTSDADGEQAIGSWVFVG